MNCPPSEDGLTSSQFAVMAFFAMLVFAAAMNLVVMQYQRGAVRFAVDESVRHGATVGNTETDCELRADQILHNRNSGLLRGSLGDSVVVACNRAGDQMVATASGRSEWWIGGLPDLEFTIMGRAIIETFEERP